MIIDRAKIGLQSDIKRKAIPYQCGKCDIISFLTKYEEIYNNEQNRDDIIIYVRNKCKLRRTYNKQYRDEIKTQLQIDTDHYYQIQKFLYRGFNEIWIEHLTYFISFCWGLMNFEEMTKTKLIQKGHYYKDQNGSLQSVNIPQFPIPPTFVITIARDIGITSLDENMLIRCGFHVFSAHRGSMKAYYRFSYNIHSEICML